MQSLNYLNLKIIQKKVLKNYILNLIRKYNTKKIKYLIEAINITYN